MMLILKNVTYVCGQVAFLILKLRIRLISHTQCWISVYEHLPLRNLKCGETKQNVCIL